MMYEKIWIFTILTLLSSWSVASQISSSKNYLPSKILTPGRSTYISNKTICKSSQKIDEIPYLQTLNVFKRYKITDTNNYGIHLLIPSSLGGTFEVQNLWPMPKNANITQMKGILNQRLVDLICINAITLSMAQTAIKENWMKAFEKYVPRGSKTQTSGISPNLFINGDGNCPVKYVIKGTLRKTYLLTSDTKYYNTAASICFETENEAKDAGYKKEK